MSFYEERLLPRLIALAMRNKRLAEIRARVIPAAEGRVLEIGIGSGLNLPYYGPAVSQVIGVEPSAGLRRMAEARARDVGRRLDLLPAAAEAIPLESHSIDTVVTTWTLCSVNQAAAALAEARRVLRPGGRLLFVEHGRAPDERVRVWQDRLTPLWRRMSGNCHLNRPMDELILSNGFRFDRLEAGYRVRGPRLFTWLFEGAARPS